MPGGLKPPVMSTGSSGGLVHQQIKHSSKGDVE